MKNILIFLLILVKYIVTLNNNLKDRTKMKSFNNIKRFINKIFFFISKITQYKMNLYRIDLITNFYDVIIKIVKTIRSNN